MELKEILKTNIIKYEYIEKVLGSKMHEDTVCGLKWRKNKIRLGRAFATGQFLFQSQFLSGRNRLDVVRFLAVMAEKDFLPLTQNVVRGLNDKLYEKRKTAALEIER